MKKMDIKDNVDEMVLKICKYIRACDLSDKEDFELKLECAMTLVVAAIDFTDEPIKNMDYIAEQHSQAITAILLETGKTIGEYLKGKIDEDRLI